MAEPKKKIRITFLWADEAAVVADFSAKYSQKLVEWADAFFGQYGFELDVQPPPGGAAQEAYRYTLAKSDGYEPDISSFEEFADRLFRTKKPTLREWLQAEHDIVELENREAAKKQEIDAALFQLSTLPLGEIAARLGPLQNLFIELQKISDALRDKRKLYQDLSDKLEDIDRQYAKEKTARDFDTPARLLLGQKVLASFPVSALTHVKTSGENARIFAADRLKIIFCRFRLSASLMTLRPSPQPYGITREAIGFNTLGGRYLWDGAFILVNVIRREQITLAHEIVHAAGRDHITDVQRIKDIARYVRSITSDPVTGRLEIPTIYETVYGGYYDGPDNDIINYHSKGKKPDEVILQDDDKQRLEASFFVATPP